MRLRSLSPLVFKCAFCSDLIEELWVKGCLFNVTFTSDAGTQLAVYYRAHDNDLGKQSATLTLTLSSWNTGQRARVRPFGRIAMAALILEFPK